MLFLFKARHKAKEKGHEQIIVVVASTTTTTTVLSIAAMLRRQLAFSFLLLFCGIKY
jgi:hypothetical protein